MLTVRLTKISDARHRIEFIREDGSRESHELATRSFLLHDLIHFAVENEANLRHSFYGALADGRSYNEMSERVPLTGELLMTERVVGAMTGCAKGVATPADFVAGMKNLLDTSGEPMPAWITTDFAERVVNRMRRLQGEWRATRFGHTMELTFADRM
jgi:hypothetical protein